MVNPTTQHTLTLLKYLVLNRGDKSLKQNINVIYEGILPDLFSEGQGVVMTGKLVNQNTFMADEVLAKHDENYMPPEVADMMKNKDGDN